MYHILIVDDEKIERNGMIFLLKKMGMDFQISEAANGKAALEYMIAEKEKGDRIDILLTDVKMPFMDGIELIHAVKEAGIESHNIIFSGYNEFEYAKLAVKLGVKDYILKPVDPKEFFQTMNQVIEELDRRKEALVHEQKLHGYMREYALYGLLNGRNVNEFVNMEFCKDYKRILFMEFQQDFFGKDVTDFSKEVLDEMEGLQEPIYLNLNQQQGVILLKEAQKAGGIDHNYFLQVAQSIQQRIFEKFGHHCYIAVSKPVEHIQEIPEAMDYLEELMENRFYHPDVYVFSGQRDTTAPDLVQIDDDTLMKQMKQDMKMKDIAALKEHFGRLSSKYHNQSYFSHIYIKFIFSNLLKEFYEHIPGADEERFNKEVERLYTSDDLDTIIALLQEHIDELEKHFYKNPQTTHREIEQVKEYIYGHYNEEIGVDQLADMVYLTPSYLSAIFKKETGQNLSKFIKQYRMEQAKDMLENTNKKIVQISNETGYANVSYFCQSFREYFGVSPQKFRDQGGVEEIHV